MSNREMQLIPMGVVGSRTVVKGTYGGTSAAAKVSERDRKGAENETDAVYLRMFEEKTKNRRLNEELKRTKAVVKALFLRRELEKKVFVAAMRVLGWLAIAATCVAFTVSTVMVAPLWTAIAPAVLAGLATRKARDAM